MQAIIYGHRSEEIGYTVYPPRFNPDRDACRDFRTATRARLAAKHWLSAQAERKPRQQTATDR